MSGKRQWPQGEFEQSPEAAKRTREVLRDIDLSTPLQRATAAIDEAASRHPELSGTTSVVREGADEVFWRDYGDRALFYHPHAGTHLLGGLILDRYRKIGGAMSSGLGAPETSEVWGDPIVETRPDGSPVVVTPKIVRFIEGTIAFSMDWGPTREENVRVTRPINSRCTLQWDFDIVQQRSGNDYHDEDWLCSVWAVGGAAYAKAVPLLHRLDGSSAIHGRPENAAGRTPIATIEDFVVCNRHERVSVSYGVINLSGIDREKQTRFANDLAHDVLEKFLPIYSGVAEAVLGAFIPVLALPFVGLNLLAPDHHRQLGDAAALAWDRSDPINVVADAVRSVLGARHNCAGPIMNDHVVFEPMAATDQQIDKTYTAERAEYCQTPETLVRLHMVRSI